MPAKKFLKKKYYPKNYRRTTVLWYGDFFFKTQGLTFV